MTNRTSWGWLLALVVGCSSTPLLDAEDDMGGSGASTSPGTLAGTCSCLETSCEWPVTECAAEPDCATWLSCAKQCPMTTDQWSSSCVDSCPEPGTSRGAQLRDDLVLCASTTPGCCGDQDEPPAPARDAGYEAVVDSGAGGGGGSGGSAPIGATDAICPGETCNACLLAIKGNKDGCASGPDPTCGETIAACYHENGYPETAETNHCWQYVTRADCNLTNASDVLEGDCGYEVPPESDELTYKTLQCALSHCPICFPGANADCFACQLDACPDESNALMHDAEAQRLQWCFEACTEQNDQAGCRLACQQEHGAGMEVLQLLLACKKNNCEQACGAP